MLLDIIFILGGLALLYYGGELLIGGCLRIAQHYRVSPFVIGATVMGFGTSAPELAVSLLAALEGSPEVAMGNVVGSNIANVGLVLGLTALLVPVPIDKARFRLETPPLLIASFLLILFSWDQGLVRWEGLLFLAGIGWYIARALKDEEESLLHFEDELKWFRGKPIGFQFILIVVGLALLVAGARGMVVGGVSLARSFGISEWFIGVTIIAVGTSLPEIVSSTMSAMRGHGEMALGNVFGSNIFNIFLVLGATASIDPLIIQEPIRADLIFTTALTCMLLIMINMKHRLEKGGGVVLLAGYAFYIGAKGLSLF
ncbi:MULTISPECIES: calcium/sodium antiporter [unclassified Nitrospina]|uniref:calcium/sodium antiporter n=1 Tax=unclassified Nitrospina TaxID=2638683 RepID=UPI003F975EF1